MACAIRLFSNPAYLCTFSLKIPMCIILFPDRMRRWRQCRGAFGSYPPPTALTQISSHSPKNPSAIISMAVFSDSGCSCAGTIMATLFTDFETWYISRASSRFMAMRASVSTCLSAVNASIVTSQCKYGHVPMHTASTSSRWTTSRQSVEMSGMPNSSATF